MAAFFNFVRKGNGVIGIAYNAFTLGIKQKLFAAEGVFSRALSVRSEIGGGAYIGPFYISALSEIVKQLLMCGGKRLERVGEIGSVGSVSQKVLTAQLRNMEENGLVHREVYAEVPPRVEYSLTELGRSLKPILDSMMIWGEEYKKLSESETEK